MYGNELAGVGSSPSYEARQTQAVRMPTLKERMDMAVKDAEDRLAELKEARALLDKNPDLERLLNIMQKGRF